MTLCAITQYYCFGSFDTELSLSINCTLLHCDFRRQFFAPVYGDFVLIKRIYWTERCVKVVLKLFINALNLDGEADLEQVGDVMAVAGLLKLFLVSL